MDEIEVVKCCDGSVRVGVLPQRFSCQHPCPEFHSCLVRFTSLGAQTPYNGMISTEQHDSCHVIEWANCR